MEYKINSGIWSEVVALPAAIIDNYIKLASGASIKVLLYMLRHNAKVVSTEQICTDINLSRETVEDSFAFWEQLGVITTHNPPQTTHEPICCTPSVVSPSAALQSQSSQNIGATITATATDYSPAHLKPTEIEAIIKNNTKLQFLAHSIQQSFARPLTYSEQNLIIWMSDTLGFEAEIILTLCEYCANSGKANARYIETLANSWFSAEINTFEKANNEVTRLTERNSYINSISQLLKLKSYPSTNQCKIIEQWQQLGIASDLILKAYDRTIDSIGSLKFPYMNKILMNWNSNGLKTIEDIENFESHSKKPSNKNNEHSYDINELAALAIGIAPRKE